MTKRLVVGTVARVVILALVAAGLYLLPSPRVENPEKNFQVERAKVDLEVTSDGRLDVSENLRFDFTGRFTGAYRDIPLQAGVEATRIRVSEDGDDYRPGGNTTLGSYDLPDTYGAELVDLDESEGAETGLRIVWHYVALDEKRSFEVDFAATGAVNVYDDVAELSWAVWGDQWNFWLDELETSLTLPNGAEPIDVWVRPHDLQLDPETGTTTTLEATRLEQGEQVVIRALFPRESLSSFAGANVIAGDGLEMIRAEEQALEGDVGILTKLRNLLAGIAPVGSLLLTAALLLATGGLAVGARERDVDIPRHLPEPPESIPPALAYAIATEGRYEEEIVVATLLDLVDRGYYEARADRGMELDLLLKVAESRPDTAPLLDYERRALDFFDRLLKQDEVAFSKLKDRVPKHSDSWRKRWNELETSLDEAEVGQLNWDLDNTSRRNWLALGGGLLYLMLLVSYFLRTAQLGIPLLAMLGGLMFVYLPPKEWLRRLDPEARERNARWAAFKRWTKDFPSLADDPPASLPLWRSILVYAVAFGTAEKIARSGRIPEPVMEGAGGGWESVIFHQHSLSAFGGFGSEFSSQVAPESSSGGGGFSGGGGGGFSGGGGGGAW